MNLTDKITITNEDNLELMKRYPDNYFDLAIVDPPYGIGANKMTLGNGKKKIFRGIMIGTIQYLQKNILKNYLEYLNIK